jgi:hypothetical protein
MKVFNLIAATITISMLACQIVSAQNATQQPRTKPMQTITEDEFGILRYKAHQKLESQPFRTITVEEVFSNSETVPVETTKTVYESAYPLGSRVVTETKTSEGISRTGFMMIKDDRYRMDTNGVWILDPRAGYGSAVGSGSGVKPIPQVYTFIGESTLEGKPVFIYEVSGKRASYFRKRFTETDEQTRYWFSRNGMLLRVEGVDNYPSLNIRVKKLVINQYNANIKIQVSNVNGK